MSQKTNPTSLRLQKSHKYFESCWYSDYFYNEINSHDLQIRSYIQSVLDQISYSQAFLYTQNYYKRFIIYLFIQDARGIRSEREQSLRSSFIEGTKIRTQVPVTVTKKGQATLACLLSFWDKQSFGVSLFKQTCLAPRGASTPRDCLISQANVNEALHPKVQRLHQVSKRQAPIPYEIGASTSRLSTSEVQALLGEGGPPFPHPYQKYSPKLPLGGKEGLWHGLVGSTSIPQSGINDYNSSQLIEMALMGILQTNSPYLINFTSIYPIRIIQDIQNASFLINEILNLLQKRVGFRQIKDQILREICNSVDKNNHYRAPGNDHSRQLYSHKIIKGMRLTCSGRFGGRSKKAQKTKTQSIRWGETSLHVFESKLSFASKSANTSFGKIGVKVWICFY